MVDSFSTRRNELAYYRESRWRRLTLATRGSRHQIPGGLDTKYPRSRHHLPRGLDTKYPRSRHHLPRGISCLSPGYLSGSVPNFSGSVPNFPDARLKGIWYNERQMDDFTISLGIFGSIVVSGLFLLSLLRKVI